LNGVRYNSGRIAIEKMNNLVPGDISKCKSPEAPTYRLV
jgi:hypothetical protein